MNINEKIELLQAARDGKKIQMRNIGGVLRGRLGLSARGRAWVNIEEWSDLDDDDIKWEGTFNFGMFEYRVKPRSLMQMAEENGVDLNALRVIAAKAKDYREYHGPGITVRPVHRNGIEFSFHFSGDVQAGCQFVPWPEVDAFAKEQGWW